ncbi:tetratricopeptide repeat protein [Streptomyces sp. E-08]|uniref:tetratricopeptide repeat protein n=1 Tax=Streptomyces sp. E-08 TaxID=3404047 RepID=UPI003CF3B511
MPASGAGAASASASGDASGDASASGAACARATALIAAGRYAEAREAAETALEEDGPEPALFLVLARAHTAEDDDDHDDDAERVFRRALDAFPDHLDLLAGYAELCLRSDPLDRPGRHARGPVLLDRLRELAPDSPSCGGPASRPPSSPPRPGGRRPPGYSATTSSTR